MKTESELREEDFVAQVMGGTFPIKCDTCDAMSTVTGVTRGEMSFTHWHCDKCMDKLRRDFLKRESSPIRKWWHALWP